MKLTAWLSFTVCAALAACASQPKEPPRIMMQGFSISAPKEMEKTWVVAQQSPELTVIGKQGRFTGESFAMQTTIIKLPALPSSEALVRYVESNLRKEIDPKRFRLFKLETTEQKVHEQSCALSRVEMAERNAADSTGSPVNTMLETMTLTCPHPQDPLRAINMAYTHRHLPEDVDPQFAQEGAMLMQTLAFEPL
jgi:hypothetical protein